MLLQIEGCSLQVFAAGAPGRSNLQLSTCNL